MWQVVNGLDNAALNCFNCSEFKNKKKPLVLFRRGTSAAGRQSAVSGRNQFWQSAFFFVKGMSQPMHLKSVCINLTLRRQYQKAILLIVETCTFWNCRLKTGFIVRLRPCGCGRGGHQTRLLAEFAPPHGWLSGSGGSVGDVGSGRPQ